MATFSQIFAPNRIVKVNTDASTSVLIIAMNGVGYASLAALLAAGQTPFPFGGSVTAGLDKGMFLESLSVENVTDPTHSFAVAWNTATAPTGDSMTLVPGGVAQFTFPGPVWNCWVQKSNSGDHLVFTGLY